MKNKAAETLRATLWDESDGKGNHINFDDRVALVDAALAEERRATVARIRKAMFGRREVIRGDVPALQLHDLLNEEEER